MQQDRDVVIIPTPCPNCGHNVRVHDEAGVCPVMSCECPVPMPENRRA